MKVEASIGDVKPAFRPVEVTLTIETAEEFNYLWNLLNASQTKQLEYFQATEARPVAPGPMPKFHQTPSIGYTLWNALDEIAEQEGWK